MAPESLRPRAYKISVPQSQLDDLRQRLRNTRFPDEPSAPPSSSLLSWDQGTPLSDVRRLVSSWQTFDWRRAEERINQHEHFMTDIEVPGFRKLDIHFIHRRSDNPNAIPLLFVHGWPGNFLEALKLKDLMFSPKTKGVVDDDDDLEHPDFHLIAPSLPNFGFSSSVSERGFGLAQYASVCHALMQQLGYKQYVTQAGDWGFWITRALGHLYPESVKASHYNMAFASEPQWTKHPLLALQHLLTPYSAAEKAGLERSKWFRANSQGYNYLQSTRPQTLGYALSDSPAALLSWIYEKLHDWTDAYPWTDEEVLEWISVYWFSTAGPAAPQRIYHEVWHEQDAKMTYAGMTETTAKSVKLGFTYNPKELEIFPRTWVHTLGNVVFEAENQHGGHFYAHEHPEWLLRDLRSMFGRGGQAYKVINGTDGFQ